LPESASNEIEHQEIASPIQPYEGDLADDIARIGTVERARAIIGGFSTPGKMPEFAYSIPAERCNVGAKLRNVRDSVCASCYAMKNRYLFPNVREAMERRYRSLSHSDWVPAMVLMIRAHYVWWFRWHDSGDLLSSSHLHNIVTVAQCKHWLPTREQEILQSYRSELPENLCVRLSSRMINGTAPNCWPWTSTVATSEPASGSYLCPAPDQGNVCGYCRACWDKEVTDVCYRKH
jgi:hypothetical protein